MSSRRGHYPMEWWQGPDPEVESEEVEPFAQSATYGRCTACGAIEAALVSVTGYQDLSAIGESPRYPIGYGCEFCA